MDGGSDEMGWLGRTVARRGPWELTLHWREMHGRIECVGVDVRSFRMRETAKRVEHRELPGGGAPRATTKATLARLPLSEVIAGARRDHREQLLHIASGLLPATRAARETARQQLPAWERDREARLPKKGRSRPRLGPEHYARVLEMHTQAKAAGLPPTKTIAEAFGAPYPTAASWVHRARKAARQDEGES